MIRNKQSHAKALLLLFVAITLAFNAFVLALYIAKHYPF